MCCMHHRTLLRRSTNHNRFVRLSVESDILSRTEDNELCLKDGVRAYPDLHTTALFSVMDNPIHLLYFFVSIIALVAFVRRRHDPVCRTDMRRLLTVR